MTRVSDLGDDLVIVVEKEKSVQWLTVCCPSCDSPVTAYSQEVSDVGRVKEARFFCGSCEHKWDAKWNPKDKKYLKE